MRFLLNFFCENFTRACVRDWSGKPAASLRHETKRGLVTESPTPATSLKEGTMLTRGHAQIKPLKRIFNLCYIIVNFEKWISKAFANIASPNTWWKSLFPLMKPLWCLKWEGKYFYWWVLTRDRCHSTLSVIQPKQLSCAKSMTV